MKHKRIVIFPYSMGSAGAKLVQEKLKAMGVECIRVWSDQNYCPKDGDFILSWGAGHTPDWWYKIHDVSCTVINPPKAICKSVDKITSFRAFDKCGVPTPPWTLEQEKALSWSKNGKWVCCRQSTEGMDGRGLVLAKDKSEIVWAPLYTQFVPNEREFRVYVMDSEVLDVLEKQPDDEATNEFIRTEANHYIYTRPHGSFSKIGEAAIGAAEANGLRFAGVDVILGKDKQPYVLETNTAPGVGSITAMRIAGALRKAAGL